MFRPFSPATRQFVQAAWKSARSKPWDFLHSYIYARWPYLYIGIGNDNPPIARWLKPLLKPIMRLFSNGGQPSIQDQTFTLSHTKPTGTLADIYHGKVMPKETAQELVMVKESIHLPDLEQVIPYIRARAIIQENPDHILLMQCPCRMSKENPCLPLDVCMVIGEPFAAFTQQHYPERGRRITQQEAFEVLERENERGRVHHAFFSEMMLGRLFAICNCCSCCCVAMKNHRRGTPMLASSGYLAVLDKTLCTHCEPIPGVCPFNALAIKDGRCHICFERCMGCGICAGRCSENAITLHRDPQKGFPLEISRLMDKVPSRKSSSLPSIECK